MIDPSQGDGEIIVTAQKRAEPIGRVPISISTLQSDQLGASGAANFQEIQNYVPGFRIGLVGPNMTPTIRGISSSAGGAANVATYIDGFYQPSLLGNSFDLENIESLQVVKGPQGTLFGRNATGGAIVIKTRSPSFDTSVNLQASYGSFDDRRLNVYASTGITDQLAVNVAGYIRKSDGFVRNVYNGRHDAYSDQKSVRGKLLYKPTDRLTLELIAGYASIDDPGSSVFSLDPKFLSGSLIATLAPDAVITTRRKETAQNTAVFTKVKTANVGLKTEYDLGDASLTMLTGYRHEKADQVADLDGSSSTIFDTSSHRQDKTFTQEVNLVSTGNGPFQFSLGAFYYHDVNVISPFNLSYCDGCSFVYIDSRLKTEAAAVFADATYEALPSLFITAGLRYSLERQTYSFASLGVSDRRKDDWKTATPRFVARYEFSPSTNVYASYSKGFKAGIFPNGAAATSALNPEKVDAYEVGAKWEHRGWRAALAGYYYKYKDMQIFAYDATTAQSLFRNAASATIKGIDFDMSGAITSRLSVYANAAYLHGRYGRFDGAIDTAPNITGAGYSSVAVSASGNMLQQAPAFTFNAGANYAVPVSFGTLSLSANIYHSSRIFYDAPNRFVQPGYELVNISAGWTSTDDRWSLELYGKNVTDTVYRNYIDPLSFAILANWGAPASYGVRLGYKF